MAEPGHELGMHDRCEFADSVALSGEARFAELYDRNHCAIRDYCRRRIAGHLVDDAVAETFLTAWRRLDDVPPGEDARLWLYRVAYRVVGHHWRSRTRRARLERRLGSVAARPQADADQALIAADEHRLVLAAAANLNPTDAEVLRLRMWDGLTIGDIASLLDLGPNAVRQRLHRAKRNLAREYRLLDTRPSSTPDAPKGGAR